MYVYHPLNLLTKLFNCRKKSTTNPHFITINMLINLMYDHESDLGAIEAQYDSSHHLSSMKEIRVNEEVLVDDGRFDDVCEVREDLPESGRERLNKPDVRCDSPMFDLIAPPSVLTPYETLSLTASLEEVPSIDQPRSVQMKVLKEKLKQAERRMKEEEEKSRIMEETLVENEKLLKEKDLKVEALVYASQLVLEDEELIMALEEIRKKRALLEVELSEVEEIEKRCAEKHTLLVKEQKLIESIENSKNEKESRLQSEKAITCELEEILKSKETFEEQIEKRILQSHNLLLLLKMEEKFDWKISKTLMRKYLAEKQSRREF